MLQNVNKMLMTPSFERMSELKQGGREKKQLQKLQTTDIRNLV
jgi:hypothetical protein